VPPGPRLTFVRWTLKPPLRDVVTAAPDGSSERVLVSAGEGDVPVPKLFVVPSWSPDGTTMAFTGVDAEPFIRGHIHYKTRIYLVGADGSGLRGLPGTEGGFEPVFSPDGHTIAFTKKRKRYRPNGHGGEQLVYRANTAWLIDLWTGETRQLTPWRNRVADVPTSFSPDGSRLALTRRPGGGEPIEAAVIVLPDGRPERLQPDASDPVFSPDGSQFSFLRGHDRTVQTQTGPITVVVADIWLARANGTEARRLTHLGGAGAATPDWDPSGERLAFVSSGSSNGDELRGIGDAVMEVNSDGTCLTEALPADPNISYSGVTWQSGPGRGAGRIAC
jgi:TolB protein